MNKLPHIYLVFALCVIVVALFAITGNENLLEILKVLVGAFVGVAVSAGKEITVITENSAVAREFSE